jgi:hypothetical protein
MASNGKGVDVRGELVNLLGQKIASDRTPVRHHDESRRGAARAG